MIGRLHISLPAIRHNARTLRDLVGHQHAAFVVKSNAYGHGLVETALAAEPFAARLCVYSVSEAVTLRDGGVTAPILVLGPIEAADLGAATTAKVEITLWSAGGYARSVAAAARKRNIRAPVHLKVNTGLNRLGFDPDELSDAVEDLLHVSELQIAGVFSHLSSAEELDSPATLHQLQVFEKVLASSAPLFARANCQPVRHIAASAAAMLWPQTRLDQARFGIAMYGLWPSKPTREAMEGSGLKLRPALSYRSKIVAVRHICAGAPVGYGATYHAPRDMRLGVVPAGYADGVPRALSNRGAFLADGEYCPIVGRIAMNVSEIDLTRAPNAQPGSQVTLIGSDGSASIGADDWAQWAQTINYEIVAGLPSRLPRVFDETPEAAA